MAIEIMDKRLMRVKVVSITRLWSQNTMETITNPQINFEWKVIYSSQMKTNIPLFIPCPSRVKYHILIPLLHFPVKGHLLSGNHIHIKNEKGCHKPWNTFGVCNMRIYHLWVRHKSFRSRVSCSQTRHANLCVLYSNPVNPISIEFSSIWLYLLTF